MQLTVLQEKRKCYEYLSNIKFTLLIHLSFGSQIMHMFLLAWIGCVTNSFFIKNYKQINCTRSMKEMTKTKLNATSFAMRMKMVCAVLVNNCLSFCILLGLDSKDKWIHLKKIHVKLSGQKSYLTHSFEICAVHSIITITFLYRQWCIYLAYITHSVYFHNQWIQLNWMLNKQYIIIFKYTFKLYMFTLMATTKNKTLTKT